jgi:imidazolonepropionase
MIDAGLPLALATDFNPGSSPSGSMPFVMSLACTRMKLLPEEALVACTLNGAAALDLSDKVGSISPGQRADLIVTRHMRHLSEIPYFFTRNPVEKVMAGGNWV